jgi:hypothetical protein
MRIDDINAMADADIRKNEAEWEWEFRSRIINEVWDKDEPKQELHTCKYCGAETTQPDDECYAKSKQESYICPHTNVQCDDECCVSAENCNIDNDELEYPISEDCEAVKNWDSFVEQKNNELEVEKLASDYIFNRGISKGVEQRMIDSFVAGFNKAKENYEVASSVRELHEYKLGLEDGYKKAKETLYTKEEMLECWNTSIIDITTFETFIELLKHPKK